MSQQTQAPFYNSISCLFGKRGTGKSEYIKGNPSLNLKGIFNTYLKKGMKVLIIDTFDHPSYREIPILPLEKISTWKSGVYRIFVNVDDMPKLCALINENLWNTLLIFEDAHKHQYNRIDRSVMRLIGDSKQKNIDIIFMYHNFGLAPKDLYRYLDYIEIFKTKDHPEVRKDDMPGYYSEVLAAYTKVMNDKNPFAHKLVNTNM